MDNEPKVFILQSLKMGSLIQWEHPQIFMTVAIMHIMLCWLFVDFYMGAFPVAAHGHVQSTKTPQP